MKNTFHYTDSKETMLLSAMVPDDAGIPTLSTTRETIYPNMCLQFWPNCCLVLGNTRISKNTLVHTAAKQASR